MEEVLIQCSPGISGDMLLGAFYDLGVPRSVIEQPLKDLKLDNLYRLKFVSLKSCSIRGINVRVEKIESSLKKEIGSIKKLIVNSKLDKEFQKIIYKVFESLAIAKVMYME